MGLTGTTLVLGGTGSFGGAVAMELLNRGREVRLLVRDIGKGRARYGDRANGELIEGDVLDAAAVRKAAAGCTAIVHGVNVPFHRWEPFVERATANVIEAAAAAGGATILFPGTVYALGDGAGGAVSEEAPDRPTTGLGRVRARVEEMLRGAVGAGGCRVIVLRAGDYFGPTVRNGLVDPIFRNAAEGRAIRAIGNLEADHQWAYVPDLARAGVMLLDLGDRLAPFEVVNFGGHVARPQRVFLRTVAAQAGRPDLAIKRLPWWMVRAAGLFDPAVRGVLELAPLYEAPLILDDSKLRRLLPEFAPTPLEAAVKATLGGSGRWVGGAMGVGAGGGGGGAVSGASRMRGRPRRQMVGAGGVVE